MRNWIIVALITLLCLGSAYSAFTPGNFERGTGVASVTGLRGTYVNTCANFSWTANTQTSDQNSAFSNQHYIVRATSNQPDLVEDLNTTATRYTACTMSPGDWVKVVVYRVDGNASGIFLNLSPDANATVNPGTVAQAGTYLVYNMIVAIGGLVALIVLTLVMVVVLTKIGFNFGSMFGK